MLAPPAPGTPSAMPQTRPKTAGRVERWPLDRIREAARNPRTHSPGQIEEIAASMREFGWTIPLLVDEAGEIIAGHGRLAAARLLDYKDAPVLIGKGWTEAQKRAYRIADNKLALNAGWDWELLALEVGELMDLGIDMELAGFSALEVSSLLAEPDEQYRHLVDSEPAEDDLWPTLKIRMPQNEFDRVTKALDEIGTDMPTWRRLVKLLFEDKP